MVVGEEGRRGIELIAYELHQGRLETSLSFAGFAIRPCQVDRRHVRKRGSDRSQT